MNISKDEQIIYDLINTDDIANWKLAYQLCIGLGIQNPEIVVAERVYKLLRKSNANLTQERIDFIHLELKCTWDYTGKMKYHDGI